MLSASTLYLQKHTILISFQQMFPSSFCFFLITSTYEIQLSSYFFFFYKFSSIGLFMCFWKSFNRLWNDDWIFFLGFLFFNDIMVSFIICLLCFRSGLQFLNEGQRFGLYAHSFTRYIRILLYLFFFIYFFICICLWWVSLFHSIGFTFYSSWSYFP